MRRGLFLVLSLIVASCGGGEGGEDLSGEELFSQTVLEEQAGCTTCHSLEPDDVIVGPSLATIGADAGNRVEGLSAAAYIEQSILDPQAYVVEGFAAGTMPTWQGVLSDSQVDALVEFLLTQTG